MWNPFDDPDGTYLVLRNDENQYSLWPAPVAVPAGWERVHGESDRASCLDYIRRNWSDMRPQSLVRRMSAADPA